MTEIWKDIYGYEGKYKISNYGRVMSLQNRGVRYRNPSLDSYGYRVVSLWNNGKGKTFKVHRLVAVHFIDKKDKGKNSVNHKDGDKENNHVNNLEWTTESENNIHAWETGLFNRDKIVRRVKESNSRGVVQIDPKTGQSIKEFPSAKDAGRELKIDSGEIGKSCNNERRIVCGYNWVWSKEYVSNKNYTIEIQEYKALSPDGKVYIFSNMSAFEREHNLSKGGISKCLAGKVKQNKGWRFEKL